MGFQRSGSYIFADINISNFDGHKLLSNFLIKIELKLDIFNSKKVTPVFLQNMSVELNLIRKNFSTITIGHMYSMQGSKIHYAYENGSKESREEFGIKLSRQDIEEIEKERNGEGVSFELKLNGTIVEDSNFLPAFETKQFSIEQSKWISILDKIEFSKIITIEIPTTGINSNPDYQLSYDRLLDAQNAFQRADWRQSVALCRDSLEAMPCYSDEDKKINPNQENTNLERVKMIRQKVVHLTHLAKHFKDDLAQKTKWTRDDALFAISAAGLIINKMSKGDE